MTYMMAKNLQVGDVQHPEMPFERTVVCLKVSEADPTDDGYQAVSVLWENTNGNRNHEYYDGTTTLDVVRSLYPTPTQGQTLCEQARWLLKSGGAGSMDLAEGVLKFFGEEV